METPRYFRNEIRRADLAWDDWDAVRAFLEDQAVCRVAVHDAPFPYVVPQSYRFVGDAFLVHCARSGRAARCIAANPHVTIEVDQAVSLLKAPRADNTSLEYRSVIARCTVRATLDDLGIEEQQYAALEKYRPERDYRPIDRERATRRIVALRCEIVELSAKKRILADGQAGRDGFDPGYARYPFPAPAALSSLPPGAFDPARFS
jgi:nitroimidazol reductase NimA-like FMN-containing flavoprotein (pyridoxamine 5'-phosphate oxidase superfamily)